MLRTWHFHCWGPGLIPGWRTKIPEASWHSPKIKIKKKKREGKVNGVGLWSHLLQIVRVACKSQSNGLPSSSQIYKDLRSSVSTFSSFVES